MSIDELRTDAVALTRWQRHRYLLLIAGVITISLFLVALALYLYNVSGAAQVDLSRPGYQSIQKEVGRETVDAAFPSSGPLDAAAFDEFNKDYDKHADRVTDTNSFDERALSDESLQTLSSNAAAAGE